MVFPLQTPFWRNIPTQAQGGSVLVTKVRRYGTVRQLLQTFSVSVVNIIDVSVVTYKPAKLTIEQIPKLNKATITATLIVKIWRK